MEYKNRVFDEEIVVLDGNRYEKCTFTRCKIKFLGHAPVYMHTCKFDEGCEHILDGPAGLTVNFLAAVYSAGEWGKILVEQTFENIKSGLLTRNVGLYFTCPETKELFKVGQMDRTTFASLDFGKQTIDLCPKCGKAHTWTKNDIELKPAGLD